MRALNRFRRRRVAADRGETRATGDKTRVKEGKAHRGGPSVIGRMLARIVGLITTIIVGLIILGIVLVVLKANPENAIVDFIRETAKSLSKPFDAIFELEKRRTEIAVNWGIAAGVYAIVGGLIARLLRR